MAPKRWHTSHVPNTFSVFTSSMLQGEETGAGWQGEWEGFSLWGMLWLRHISEVRLWWACPNCSHPTRRPYCKTVWNSVSEVHWFHCIASPATAALWSFKSLFALSPPPARNQLPHPSTSPDFRCQHILPLDIFQTFLSMPVLECWKLQGRSALHTPQTLSVFAFQRTSAGSSMGREMLPGRREQRGLPKRLLQDFQGDKMWQAKEFN